jgi:hypothetical protein
LLPAQVQGSVAAAAATVFVSRACLIFPHRGGLHVGNQCAWRFPARAFGCTTDCFPYTIHSLQPTPQVNYHYPCIPTAELAELADQRWGDPARRWAWAAGSGEKKAKGQQPQSQLQTQSHHHLLVRVVRSAKDSGGGGGGVGVLEADGADDDGCGSVFACALHARGLQGGLAPASRGGE